MKIGIIVIGIIILVAAFARYSYKCALKDQYIKQGDIEGVFMWQREFWSLTGSAYKSITALELPFVLIEYWTSGRSKAKWWKKQYNENVAGKTVEEAFAYQMANMPITDTPPPDSNGIIHHPTYGSYPETVEFKQGMTLWPRQSAKMVIEIDMTDCNISISPDGNGIHIEGQEKEAKAGGG